MCLQLKKDGHRKYFILHLTHTELRLHWVTEHDSSQKFVLTGNILICDNPSFNLQRKGIHILPPTWIVRGAGRTGRHYCLTTVKHNFWCAALSEPSLKIVCWNRLIAIPNSVGWICLQTHLPSPCQITKDAVNLWNVAYFQTSDFIRILTVFSLKNPMDASGRRDLKIKLSYSLKMWVSLPRCNW